MCYDIKTKLETQLKRAKHYNNLAWIADLEKELKPYLNQDIHHASGFMHPHVLIYTNNEPFKPQLYQWGLVPHWVKSEEQRKQLWNKTINARGETIYEKTSFKASAQTKHCVIYIDGFFEHHHFKGKTYPFYIYGKHAEPLVLAGLYEQNVNKQTGEVFNTFAVVTTKANNLLTKIHNNPRMKEPRIPVILSSEKEQLWLDKDFKASDMDAMLVPYPSKSLSFHTVAPLRGKNTLGNIPQASEPIIYPTLKFVV